MDQQEYEQYLTVREEEVAISFEEVNDHRSPEPWTLAYGYTTSRYDWHAYVEPATEEIHVVIYDHADRMLSFTSGSVMEAEELRPDKRVYPDTVDIRFATLMKQRGLPLPLLGNFDFTDLEVQRRALRAPLYGLTAYQLRLGS